MFENERSRKIKRKRFSKRGENIAPNTRDADTHNQYITDDSIGAYGDLRNYSA